MDTVKDRTDSDQSSRPRSSATPRFGSSKTKIRKHIPAGKGPYTVGCVDFMNDHSDDGVLFRLFYPTRKSDIYKRDKQWPLWVPRKQYVHGYVDFLGLSTKTFGKFFKWYCDDVYVPALWQAPILKEHKRKHPVVILSHGIGGNRTTYTALCCELASQGFVVAAIEHSDGSASMALRLQQFSQNALTSSPDQLNNNDVIDGDPENKPQINSRHHLNAFNEHWKKFEKIENIFDFDFRNKQVHYRADECSRMLNILTAMNNGEQMHNYFGVIFDTSQLRNSLDLSQVSVIGHSFGGSTCLCTLSKDPRFKVGVVIDGWMLPLDEQVYSKVNQPVLMVNYETFQWVDNIKSMNRFLTNEVDRRMITVKGTCHQSISDFQFIANKLLGRVMTVRYTLNPKLAFGTSAQATVGFLRKHFDLPGEKFSEILDGNHYLVINGTNVNMPVQVT
ncbi:hypothetical protein LOTGIDRAFT_237716 [Lottia gigantea]|uniref:1-alkyl-2-acetylglycerophosphocholine esterase n=1 Tax=Lottia gigantea TaxID=225164 RepID=V4CM77_LOTGI|nr:hypothetical protein LOTGIDRAFT_237716 [Lottia gigantea]ESP03410.1 hypothetical protein LOTGIDRAFT_237716 [Lottia gigantea]